MKILNKKRNKLDITPSFRNFGMAALILSLFVFLTSCADSPSDVAEKTGGITAAQIIENPAAYNGKTVTVSGDVEEIHGPRAFNMDSGLSIGELLVVGREPFPQIPEAGDRAYVVNDVATITGVVRTMVTADIEREIGWDLDPQLEAEFSGKPVLIAQKVAFRPGTAKSNTTTGVNNTVGADQMNGQTVPANNTAPMGNTVADQETGKTGSDQLITDATTYGAAQDKLVFVGKQGQFSNLRVVRVVGPRTFTVASGKGEIYVMLDDESARGVGTQGKIDVGDTVSMSGRFERLQMEEIKDIASNRFRALTQTEREFLKDTPVYFQTNKVSNLK